MAKIGYIMAAAHYDKVKEDQCSGCMQYGCVEDC
jgi:hypothetical protein